MIKSFYNTTYTATRLETTTTTGADSLITASNADCVIIPVTDKAKLFYENNYGNESDLYCDYLNDVRVGDLIYSGTYTYTTLGVTQRLDLEDDTESHLDIRVVRK